jgi:hypothetical protein
MSDAEEQRHGLMYVTARHLYRTMVYTPVYFLGFAASATVPTLLAIGAPDAAFSEYVALALGGLAVHAGQLQATEQLTTDTTEQSRLLYVSFATVSILYYNLIVASAAGIGVAAGSYGPVFAVVIAFLLPVTDVELSREYGRGGMAVAAWFAVTAGTAAETAYEDSRLAGFVTRVVAFLSTPEDIVPPALNQISLRSLTAGRRPR